MGPSSNPLPSSTLSGCKLDSNNKLPTIPAAAASDIFKSLINFLAIILPFSIPDPEIPPSVAESPPSAPPPLPPPPPPDRRPDLKDFLEIDSNTSKIAASAPLRVFLSDPFL